MAPAPAYLVKAVGEDDLIELPVIREDISHSQWFNFGSDGPGGERSHCSDCRKEGRIEGRSESRRLYLRG